MGVLSASGQSTFNSGSDGSDGPLDLTGTASGTTVYFDPSTFHGDQHQLSIFNFTQITIPSGVTLKLSGNKVNAPMYWLSQGDVNIAGTLDLSGGNGAGSTSDVDVRLPAVPGSGGYAGGIGGNYSTTQAAAPGNGPGGGTAGTCLGGNNAHGGTFTGNQFLVPLLGGSGGGGISSSGGFGNGGGAGGGAILIASSTQIVVNGIIWATGGSPGATPCSAYAGGGSGGAIRLVSNTISGNGTLSALGATANTNNTQGTPGRVRLEAFSISTLSLNGTPQSQSNPLPLFLPTTPPPTVQVTSINGTPITENPFSFPDTTLNTASSVNIIITGHEVPVGTVPTLYVFSETADTILTCPAGLQGSLDTSTCTISVPFPYGGSRGFVKATWQAQ